MVVCKRQQLATRYNELLSALPLILPYQASDTYSAYHLYVIRLKLDQCAKGHRTVFEELRARGIGVNLHYIPVHMQPYYRKMGFRAGDFPVAEQYYEEAISIPMYYQLSFEEQNQVVAALREVLR